jgi:hypothetical protein
MREWLVNDAVIFTLLCSNRYKNVSSAARYYECGTIIKVPKGLAIALGGRLYFAPRPR